MVSNLLEVGILVLATAAAVRFGRPAWTRLASQTIDPALRGWIDRSERAAGPYVHLSRGLARPARVGTPPAREGSLAIETPQAQRAVA